MTTFLFTLGALLILVAFGIFWITVRRLEFRSLREFFEVLGDED